MRTISAVIITQDEERNIGRCLESLKDVAVEVIVVDSGSTDRTEAICHEYGAKFVHHDWEGYDRQKNFANSLATQPWVLSIDGDEALSPELREGLLEWSAENDQQPVVYSVNRLTFFDGQPIRHCGWYPETKARLFPAGCAKWDGIVHEDLLFNGEAVKLKGDLLHYPYSGLGDLLAKYTKYATLMAEKYHRHGRRARKSDTVLRPVWNFIRNYFFKGGFLDGHNGFVICKMMAYYTFLKYSLLREKNKQ